MSVNYDLAAYDETGKKIFSLQRMVSFTNTEKIVKGGSITLNPESNNIVLTSNIDPRNSPFFMMKTSGNTWGIGLFYTSNLPEIHVIRGVTNCSV